MNFQDFYAGLSFDAYTWLGGHLTEEGAVFRTFAPGARQVDLIAECNGWQGTPMQKVYDGNFWEITVPGAAQGMLYKYKICGPDGRWTDHCDPYGFFAELRPATASVLYALPAEAPAPPCRDWAHEAVNIYEIHAGSWQKPGEPGAFYTFRELAARLVPYLAENHYDLLELMPLNEHPCDESWGYQATGFFSPTARYGTPDDLRFLIDACHRAGIGVILDFVPVHFAVNDYGLFRYDGTALYEYPHQDVGYSEWGSCNFIHSRGEVRSFLQSAACYWLREFGFDGLRLDAVSNLIYWQGRPERGENLAALRFLQTMNAGLKALCPGALLIAEDSSARPGVTAPTGQGGLGFDCKWDLGWMNDTLAYLQSPPEERRRCPDRLTFSMFYFYNERYLLPLSHDEVVHGKAAIVQKMYGDCPAEKLAQARLLYLYMYAHPGKKLNFMGNELGMLREWDEKRPLDWQLDGPRAAFAEFFRALQGLYAQTPAFFARDYEGDGFAWLDRPAPGRAVFAFVRRGGGQEVLVLLNFDDADLPGCELPLPGRREARLLLDSADAQWGGPRPAACWSFADGRLRTDLTHYSGQYFLLQ